MTINWMKLKLLYAAISLSVIGLGVWSLLTWGLNLGVDFKGGSLVEYRLGGDISTEEKTKFETTGINVFSIQKTRDNTYLLRTEVLSQEKAEIVKQVLTEETGKEPELLRLETVGPSIGPDLIKRTIYAIVIAASLILAWIAFQFKSIKYGISATVATFHDSLVLIGLFSLLGKYFGAEVDFLFVTALLTTLSFSVHDTIVVYDRIRETRKKHGGTITEVANKAVTETMRRSIFNSLTIIFMLLAFIILGGATIRWFALALLIGTISGTYSSPFVAVPLLVTWEEVQKKLKR